MEEKKYELVKDIKIVFDGHALYRIRALRDFNDVKKGDLGGYIEKEDNLSQDDNCWVYDDAMVIRDARICDNARIYDRVIVNGLARVFGDAIVSDDAKVFDNAVLKDHAEIFDNAEIYGNSMVSDSAKVFDYVRICDNTTVEGKSTISGKAKVHGNAKICGCSTIFGDADIFDDVCIEDDVICHTVCNQPNPPILFHIKSLRVEKIRTFDDREEEYKNNLLYVLNCISEIGTTYELRLWTEHGDCYSGWCSASWAHADLIRVDSFIGMTHKPIKELTFKLDADVIKDGKLPVMDNDIFTITDIGDYYYPGGEVEVNMNLFEEINRSKEKRPVWILKGDSALGKSYLAGIIANSDRMKTVYETDAHEELTDISHEDIIVIGNKYNYSVEDVMHHIQGDFEPIIVDFSKA